MARSTSEIKKSMTDAFLGNETLRSMYGLGADATWSGSFSAVSLENILIFIVAGCIRAFELIMDQYKVDVERKIEDAIVASVPWYHKKALEYQHGDGLVVDEDTYAYGYASVDESKRVIKYAAVRDKGTSVQIIVSGDDDGMPVALSDDVLTPFSYYMNRIKVAGVVLACHSYASDILKLKAMVRIDPLVIDEDGYSVANGSRPVEDAIKEHLKSILYGGIFNTTKLIDAIQAVDGVVDVALEEVKYKVAGASEWGVLNGNNYDGMSGSYVCDNIEEGLSYVV